MHEKLRGFIRNMGYAVLSNGVIFLSSTLISLVIPKWYPVAVYGYLQMYIFYTSYLGLFNLGWLEGIYLKIGGVIYNKIDFPLYKKQYKIFSMYIVGASVIAILLSLCTIRDEVQCSIFFGVSICIIPYGLTNYLNNLLLATERMKEYARNCFWDRFIFIVLLMLQFVFKIVDFRGIIFADIVGKTVAFISASFACKELYQKNSISIPISKVLEDIRANIASGIKLMIANLSSMFILGVVRLGIERTWDIEIYSQMALTFSISNLLLGFIAAVSQVMYTTLRRNTQGVMGNVYKAIRSSIVILLAAILVFYYPAKTILISFLPQYEFGLRYMAILLPICFVECKWSFLTLTYLKVFREEKNILKINVIAVCMSIFLSFVFTMLYQSLPMMATALIMVLFIRGTIGELLIAKKMDVNIITDIVQEAVLVLGFISVSWNIDSWICSLVYLFMYLIYVFSKRKSLINIFSEVKLFNA